MKKRLIVLGVVLMMVFAFAACEPSSSGIGALRIEGKEKIDIHAATKVEEDYDPDNWTALCDAVIEGKANVDKATTKENIDKAVDDAINAIDDIPIKEEIMGNVNFTLILGRMDYGIDTNIVAIICSFTEWSELGAVTNLPELSGRFNEQYFENKALIVFCLGRGTRGAQFEKVEVFGQDNEILVKVFDDKNGFMTVESNWIVVIAVQKNIIDSFTNLRLETNFYSFS